MLSKSVAMAFLSSVYAAELNPPNWDTDRVKVIKPGQPDAQNILDTIHNENSGMDPPNHGEFSHSRYAILLEPGTHNLNVDVGFYVTVHGLGRTP